MHWANVFNPGRMGSVQTLAHSPGGIATELSDKSLVFLHLERDPGIQVLAPELLKKFLPSAFVGSE